MGDARGAGEGFHVVGGAGEYRAAEQRRRRPLAEAGGAIARSRTELTARATRFQVERVLLLFDGLEDTDGASRPKRGETSWPPASNRAASATDVNGQEAPPEAQPASSAQGPLFAARHPRQNR